MSSCDPGPLRSLVNKTIATMAAKEQITIIVIALLDLDAGNFFCNQSYIILYDLDQFVVSPPSTWKIAPVIHLAESDAK